MADNADGNGDQSSLSILRDHLMTGQKILQQQAFENKNGNKFK